MHQNSLTHCVLSPWLLLTAETVHTGYRIVLLTAWKSRPRLINYRILNLRDILYLWREILRASAHTRRSWNYQILVISLSLALYSTSLGLTYTRFTAFRSLVCFIAGAMSKPRILGAVSHVSGTKIAKISYTKRKYNSKSLQHINSKFPHSYATRSSLITK